jgi:hypothetical protein
MTTKPSAWVAGDACAPLWQDASQSSCERGVTLTVAQSLCVVGSIRNIRAGLRFVGDALFLAGRCPATWPQAPGGAARHAPLAWCDSCYWCLFLPTAR